MRDDKLPCAFCGRALEAEALVAIPGLGRAKLACPLCAAKHAVEPSHHGATQSH